MKKYLFNDLTTCSSNGGEHDWKCRERKGSPELGLYDCEKCKMQVVVSRDPATGTSIVGASVGGAYGWVNLDAYLDNWKD